MKVSVCMTTYNHRSYIAQAIDSVMMQQTDFDYELVIGEDCSTDGTRQVCLAYREKYPDKIRLFLREKNLGMIQNYSQTLIDCTGQYVAMLDGDDYWTTPHKLQKQVNFMDAHPDCAICFALTNTVVEDGIDWPEYPSSPEPAKETYTMEDILRWNMIANCSVMYRNGLVRGLPDWFVGLGTADWPLHILIAQQGKIGCLHEVMAAYRVHADSRFSSRGQIGTLFVRVDVYRALKAHLGSEHRDIIAELLATQYQRLAIEYLRIKDRPKALRCALRGITTLPLKAYPRRLSPRAAAHAIKMAREKR